VESFILAREGIKCSLEEFLKKIDFKDVNWKSEALKDRQTKERTSIKEISGFKQKIKYLVFRYLIK
jgi:hypothetical protein